jgi:squalene-hopene/tetraprenyl-beta-curcumene cyclase
LDKDDPRVKAAISWISKNYALDQNPGMPAKHDGLFYYYHTFAKSLHALGNESIKDAKGVEHDWRSELLQVLVAKQKKNGSWVNKSSRWLEGDAELVTAYALLSLSYCKPSEPVKK